MFHYKPSILGYPYFWKHLFEYVSTSVFGIAQIYHRFTNICLVSEYVCLLQDLLFLWSICPIKKPWGYFWRTKNRNGAWITRFQVDELGGLLQHCNNLQVKRYFFLGSNQNLHIESWCMPVYMFKGQRWGVPLAVYPWYLLCSFGILGDYNPFLYTLYRSYIGISHRGTTHNCPLNIGGCQ